LRQVKGNKGSAGVDRMTVDQLGNYLKQHWLSIREQLLNGTYEPKPVRRVEIPKPDGGGALTNDWFSIGRVERSFAYGRQVRSRAL
jgi:retron-type reverse transcriptase